MSNTKTYHNIPSLEILAIRLGNHLQDKGQEVKYVANKEKNWCLIQTRREGKLISENKKCLNIVIKGTREECTIITNNGEWKVVPEEASSYGEVTPYDGIFAEKKKIVASIITEKGIFKFLDKNN